MLMLTSLSLMISLTFTMTSHPLSMGFNLLLQTVVMSLMAGMLNINFWYSFILFLIMVGGMLILFIYMTSVASNEKFNFSMKTAITLSTIILVVTPIFILWDSAYLYSELTTILTQKNMMSTWMMSLNKFLTYPHNIKLMLLMIYLFLALIAIVKITKIKYGPLRIIKNN
uniref:NADH-ubiquinone oxidoreductase chain 6 n=1 Tax=Agrilus sp. AGR01 TaxID=1205534 RepID=A0A0S2MRQ7_9COLE|nr:NADH deshydrogenase subunit 6 [Agrilus sp. AGR01]